MTKEEMQRLAEKWSKTGLLDGLKKSEGVRRWPFFYNLNLVNL